MSTEQIAELLCVSAYELYLRTLVGNPAPNTAALFEELTHPKPGDLVLETSSIGLNRCKATERIGRLIRIDEVPAWSTEENAGSDPIPTVKRWILALELEDYREFSWENASFIKVLETRFRP